MKRHKRIVLIALAIAFLAITLSVVSVILWRNNRNRGEDAYQRTELRVPLRESEHLLGVASAPVKIVEYAEVECIYCKRLHPVLLRVVDENRDRVAFVYRHFPLTVHPKSFDEAIALECATEAGGNSFFWSYLKALYEATPSNNKIDLAILPELAQTVGIPKEIFNECMASDSHKAHIRDDIESGLTLDVDSVPQLFVIAPTGKVFVFRKSPSYAVLNATVQAALELTN